MAYQIDAPHTRDRVVSFLNEIGIESRFEVGATGFVEGCRIDRGTLAIDPNCRVSSRLHDADHLAVTPSCFRGLMDGNSYASQREMFRGKQWASL